MYADGTLEGEESGLFSTNGRELDKPTKRLILLLLFWGVCLIVFVMMPIILPSPSSTGFQPYNYIVLLQQIEPLFTLPLNFFIMWNSRILSEINLSSSEQSERMWILALFMIGGAFYVEGHGEHTMAIIAKHAVQQVLADQNCPILNKSKSGDIPCSKAFGYIRNDWEHIYSHYIYAAGAFVISLSHTWAFKYRNTNSAGIRSSVFSKTPQPDNLTVASKLFFYIAAATYGLMVAGISIEFPRGLYIIPVLSLAHALIIVFWLIDTENKCKFLIDTFIWKKFTGSWVVLQYYFFAYVFSFIPMIIYVIKVRGLYDRESANVPL